MEKEVFRYLAAWSAGLFLLGFFPLALFSGVPVYGAYALAAYGLLSLVQYVLSRLKDVYWPTLTFLLALGLTAPLWFAFGGSAGPLPLIFVPLMLLINLFFRGSKRNIFFGLLIFWVSALIVLEHLHPAGVFVISDMTPRLLQTAGGTSVILVLSYLMLGAVIHQYDEEKERVRIANIELEKNNKELSELALRDRMTGLFNHQHSLETVLQECLRASRHDYPLSVIMMDVDFFKHINDTRGHQAGDKVLVESAEILRHCTRKVDTLGRYGGEEFIIILPQTPLMGAVDVAERIRREFQRHDFFGDGTKVTVSLGVAEYNGEDSVLFLEMADRELYRAKHDGRNQTRWRLAESA